MNFYSKITGFFFVALSLSNCSMYMEQQARKQGLTGDPTQGGYFGFSEELSDQRIAGMDQGRRSAERVYASRKAEENKLRSQLAAAEKRMKEAVTAEAQAMAEKDIERLRRQILALTS
jgi:hypothetical protein